MPKFIPRGLFVLGFLMLLLGAGKARAQATSSTAEQALRLQVFALGSYVRPDYGGALRNGGATVGADINFKTHFLGHAQPGIELRALGSGGRVSNQISYHAGPRIMYPLGRFQPYADFLVGYGKIHLNVTTIPGYTENNSIIYTYGGGTDFRISRAWAVRADLQRQSWQLTHNAAAFHPLAASAGIRYQFHFHNNYGPE